MENSRPLNSSSEYWFERELKELDDLVINKAIVKEWPLGRCDVCYDRVFGELDEARFQFVPGNLFRKWSTPYSNTFLIGYGTDREKHLSVGQYPSEYQMRQLIVKSGLYTREQLSSKRFNQHELELSEESFLFARSEIKRCGCTPVGWGHFTYEGEERAPSPELASPEAIQEVIRQEVEDEWTAYRGHLKVRPAKVRRNSTSHVEDRFIETGKTTRTGFRKRSPGARLRRAEKRKRSSTREVFPEPHPVALGTGLFTVNPDAKVKLVFKYSTICTSPRKPLSEAKRRRLLARSRNDLQDRPDRRMSNKSFYFLRKRGVFYHSVHHEQFRGRDPTPR